MQPGSETASVLHEPQPCVPKLRDLALRISNRLQCLVKASHSETTMAPPMRRSVRQLPRLPLASSFCLKRPRCVNTCRRRTCSRRFSSPTAQERGWMSNPSNFPRKMRPPNDRQHTEPARADSFGAPKAFGIAVTGLRSRCAVFCFLNG